MTLRTQQNESYQPLFLNEMVAKLEMTQSTAKQNNDQTLTPHKQWEQQQTMIRQHQNQACCKMLCYLAYRETMYHTNIKVGIRLN